MLHNEARSLLLQAWEKTHNAQEVAECFGVNKSTVYRLIERMAKTHDYHTQTSNRGRKAALSQAQQEQISKLVNQQIDITIAEIIDRLHLTVSDETVRRTLIRLGYTYKKKTLHATERDRPRCAGKTKDMEYRYCWCFHG